MNSGLRIWSSVVGAFRSLAQDLIASLGAVDTCCFIWDNLQPEILPGERYINPSSLDHNKSDNDGLCLVHNSS